MMTYRNARYTEDGRIDCEIEHPALGWLPFTADPNDTEQYGRDLFALIAAAGDAAPYVAPPPPDPAALLEAERAGMVVSRFQARAALSQAGLLGAAETAVAGSDDLTKLAWAEAVEFRRNSPAIATLAGALDLTDTDVDDLFRAAAHIEV